MKLSKYFLIGTIALSSLTMVSCDDDDNNVDNDGDEQTGAFFAAVSGAASQYVMQLDELTNDNIISNNIDELETSYTWIFGGSPRTAIGLAYNDGDPAPGMGYHMEDGNIVEAGSQFQLLNRFTSYGFWENYGVTFASRVTPVDENGDPLEGDDLLYLDASGNPVLWDDDADASTEEVYVERTDGVVFNFIDLDNNLALDDVVFNSLGMTGDDELQATFSGVANYTDNTFLCGMVMHYPRELKGTTSGGQSIGDLKDVDKCWVSQFTYDGTYMKQVAYATTDKMGYATGRQRSRNYPMIYTHESGDVYVFSGAYETTSTKPAAAMRINGDGNFAFDDSYFFDIESASGGYIFQRVWYISGDDFLVLFYNNTGDYDSDNNSTATKFGIVNVADKTVKFITGDFPGTDEIDAFAAEPMAHDGKVYIPITATIGGVAQDPAVYIVDPSTAIAEKGAAITGSSSFDALGYLGN